MPHLVKHGFLQPAEVEQVVVLPFIFVNSCHTAVGDAMAQSSPLPERTPIPAGSIYGCIVGVDAELAGGGAVGVGVVAGDIGQDLFPPEPTTTGRCRQEQAGRGVSGSVADKTTQERRSTKVDCGPGSKAVIDH